jgi:hypothetical protein
MGFSKVLILDTAMKRWIWVLDLGFSKVRKRWICEKIRCWWMMKFIWFDYLGIRIWIIIIKTILKLCGWDLFAKIIDKEVYGNWLHHINSMWNLTKYFIGQLSNFTHAATFWTAR